MAKKTKTALKSDITTVIDDGGELTASELRTILDDTVDSAFFGDAVTGPKGEKGDAGNQGAQGAYTVRIYTRSTSTPAPSNVTWVPASGSDLARLTNTGSPTTWSLDIPSNTAAGSLWEATATFDPASSATGISVWSTAFQAGSVGPAGPRGDKGDKGSQGSYTVRLYRRSTNTVIRPSILTWTASTGTLSGANATGWSTTVPQGEGDPVWETNAVFDPAGTDTTVTDWGIPFRLTGATGPIGPAGPAGSGSGTGLSAVNGRKLAEITEADGYAYTQVPGSELGGNTSQFSPAIMGITSSFSINIYVQVSATLTLTDDIRFRHISSDGTVKTDVALTTLTLQTGAPSGKVRYRSASPVALVAGDTIRIFSRVSGKTYTLSSKYRIPSGSIIGTTSGTKGDQGVQGSYLVHLYKRSSTAITASPADVTWTSPGTLGGANAASWSLTVPAGTNPLYTVNASFNPASPSVLSTWSNVIATSGTGSGSSLSAANALKLGDISDFVADSYAVIPDTTTAGSGTTASTANVLSAGNTRFPNVTFFADVSESLTITNNTRLVHFSSDGTVKSSTPLSSLRQVAASTGRNKYQAAGPVVFDVGDTASVSTLTPGSETFNLSSRYRIPVAGVVGLANSNIKGDKGDKGDTGPAGADGTLPALDTRKLAEITEGRRADTYANLAGSGISVAVPGSLQGSIVPRDTTNSWPETFTGGTGLNGERFFFEINRSDMDSLADLYIRRFSSAGAEINPPISLATASTYNDGNARLSKVRYLATQTINNATNGTIRIQKRSQGAIAYTLADTYRVPVSTLTGSISASKVSNTATGNLEATDVQGALNEIQSEVDGIMNNGDALPPGTKEFVDNVELNGKLTGLANATEFYYRNASGLPKTNIADWTRVTNGQFPQPFSTSITSYVILLKDKYPNVIVWDPAESQPAVVKGEPSTSTLTRSGFTQVNGAKVPNGFTAWKFRMPAWRVASSGRTGARLQVGNLTGTDVSRIDIDSTVKITDDNLDITSPNTTLSQVQQEKLQGLQLKTFSSDMTTTGKPNTAYDVLMATAWPDPDVTYSRGVSFAAQQAKYTGIVPSGSTTGSHDFFNLISDTGVTLGRPTPSISSATSLSYLTASDGPASCSGIFRGSIQATDRSTGSRMRIDDDEGLFAAMTLHTPPDLAVGTYTIMNIGNENTKGTRTLVLQNDGPGYESSGLSLRAREQTGTPTSSTAIKDVLEPLYDAVTGNDVTLFHPPVNTTPITVPHDWVVPSSYTIGASTPVTYRLSIRVWNNGNDLGEHDFTSSLPDAMQKMTSFNTAVAATTFNIPFGRVGFSGLGGETMRFTYTPVDTTSDNRRIIELALVGISNPAFTYAVRLTAVVKRSVTTPAGPTRDIVLSTMPAGDTHEIGFYVRSRDRGTDPRTMLYHVSVNGVDGTNGDDDSTGTPPTGPVPITFGPGTSPANNIAVNRFLIVKPKKVLSANQMNDLTTPSLRNRVDIGGLVRHGGGTFSEVFSAAYKSVLLTNSKQQQLRHGSATNNTATSAAATTNFANPPTPVSVSWDDSDIPIEISLNAAGDEITANTNFMGHISLDVGVTFKNSDMVAANTNPKAYLLLKGTLQEKIGSADWKDVPGPELYHDIRTQLIQGASERPETSTNSPDALVRRTFSTTVKFTSGAKYRVRASGYRLHANSDGGFSGTRNWSGNVTTVTLSKGKTFMSLDIIPSI